MEHFEEGFVNELDLTRRVKQSLNKLDFDFENDVPVLVKFPKSLIKYLFAAPKSLEIKPNDLIIVPSVGEGFLIAQVYSTLEHPDSKFANSIERTAIEIGANKIKQIKKVAYNLGDEKNGKLKGYYDNVEKTKRRMVIMKKLEKAAEQAQKIMIYEQLAGQDPEIRKLLHELKGINKSINI